MHGAGHPGLAPYAVYQTADNPIVIAAVGTEKFWRNLLAAMGLEALGKDGRFQDNQHRTQNRVELDAALASKLATADSAYWLERFEAFDVPAAPVLTVPEAMNSDHAKIRTSVLASRVAADQEASVPRLPIRCPLDDTIEAAGPTPELDSARVELLQSGARKQD